MPRSSSAGTDIQPDWLKFLLTAKSHPAILASESNSFPVYLFLSPSGREGWIKRFILFHDKCNPTEMGEKEIGQYLSFLASKYYTDRVTSERYRHHLHESVIQKAVKEAARKAGISKPASCHTLRQWNAFAAYLIVICHGINPLW